MFGRSVELTADVLVLEWFLPTACRAEWLDVDQW